MTDPRPPAQGLICPECGRSFVCDPHGDCWCKDIDLKLPLPETSAATCYCPCILTRLTEEAAQP